MSKIRRGLAQRAPIHFILLLSGCMSVERQFQLNGDGSGSYTLTLASVNQPAIPTAYRKGRRPAQLSPIMSTRRQLDAFEDQATYWTFTRPFSSVEEANTFPGRPTPVRSQPHCALPRLTACYA